MPNSLSPLAAESVDDVSWALIADRIRLVDDLDTQLLDRIQTELPLVERPYAALADVIGSDEATVLERVDALREQKVIRQISAIFDSRRLGYRGMLVAARTPAERQDAAAAVFSTHPGVSHNYLREHELNVWFTLTVSPRSQLGLDRTVELLGELAEVDVIRPMPALRFFKIGVDLDVRGDRDPAAKLVKARPVRQSPPPETLTDRDLDAIRALQRDLAAEPEPFRELAAQAGFETAELLALGHSFIETGQMRRYAAVLAHRNAGFVQNGMGVWRVPEERLDECGHLMAAFRGVSHCYQRPTYPDWPYNLFSMTHGRTKAECEAVLAAVGAETGLDDYSVLYSTKEYKKTRVSYFTPEEAAWERAHAPLAV
jgi:DNA-binding Lrp family transcriptional regulator